RLSRAHEKDLDRRVVFEGLERLEQALEAGGAVLLRAHAGNWEWAGAALSARGVSVLAPARPHRGPEAFFTRLRHRFGVRTHRSLAPLLDEQHARQGERCAWPPSAVALFLDRAASDVAHARPARVARGAAALAARRRWALLPALCLRQGQGYRIVFGPRL